MGEWANESDEAMEVMEVMEASCSLAVPGEFSEVMG
jgi:hypothetical protein